MKNFNLYQRGFIASGMILLVTTGLSACTQANERQSYVREQPMENTAMNQEKEMPTVQNLNDLESGRNLSYYTDQFKRMGYTVDDVRSVGSRQVYDLRKGDERSMVSLAMQKDQKVGAADSTVSGIDVQRYQAQTPDEQAVSAVTNELRKLKPGKKPHEYIPTIAQYGRIVEYDTDRNGAEIEFQSSKNERYYQVHMKVDPQRQIVTNIDVDRNIWGFD